MTKIMPSLNKLSASKQKSSLDSLFNKSATVQANQEQGDGITEILPHAQEFGILGGCYIMLLLSHAVSTCTIPFHSSLDLAHSWSCKLGTYYDTTISKAIFSEA